jgi:hypothetical protein
MLRLVVDRIRRAVCVALALSLALPLSLAHAAQADFVESGPGAPAVASAPDAAPPAPDAAPPAPDAAPPSPQEQRVALVAQLEGLGLSAEAARATVDPLTDLEVAQLATDLENRPAGGSAGGVILAVAIVFIALVITDALGLTDIFPWIHKA